ncbi:hypothetical protein DET49_1151 [Salegentibacter sp. 24]|nr:hypothetical protein DET49_1151 [Salegentibacter sp. 24]
MKKISKTIVIALSGIFMSCSLDQDPIDLNSI